MASISGDDASVKRSAAKRGRVGIEFDVEETMRTLEVTDDYLVLGIDEAGRGPAIGPMVYTGAMISLSEHDRLVDLCHVADSKTMDEAHRNAALAKLSELKTFSSFTISLTSTMISEQMMGRLGRNLNTLSHDAAIAIISQATLAGKGKLCSVYVDTVGPPDTYHRKLSVRFPHLRVAVSKQADSRFPIVSAASIVAKTTRDGEISALGIDCGSGYPSDPSTGRWLRSHVHRFFVFRTAHDYVRQSWGPVVQIARNHCEEVTFAQDEKEEENVKQPKLSFAKPAQRRSDVFAHFLKFRTVSSLPE